MLHDVAVVWPGSCNMVAPGCNRACALVRFSIPNMSQHVATGWPNAQHVAPNNVSKCCAEMLRAFGRNFSSGQSMGTN